ncbi:hypothetical protein FOB58_005771 [Candida parapsilosis]|uniref:Uncharacterized protein n=1 Tax=Candida parapsilosis TaxID=5480 RepID=A0A8X7NFX4_CANPA|nr:hypothetical protein FOB58_005771 [Candida parapsilosis]KAF6041856.1 hypothetical protein FOB59_005749 [Candida parapsilosis]KAF6042567.1 hypothetical protein FOB60_005766 [Candida parapsilosis]KAF6058407.1 hypothetical protein FOB61_005568 [Candida parapsilosis]CAD1812663.1 unnamed protein product [Candida parapsilosis]
MSHDYSQDFIKLQLEEDAFFNQLSYGHINADRTIEVLRSKQQPQAVDLSNRLSCGNEKDQKKLSLDNEFQSIQLDWYTLHLNQLTALRAKINQQQLKAYNKSVDQFRKREIHWIQSYRKRKQLETKKRQKKLEDRTMRLEKIRQLKQRVRDVTKKMSVRMHNTCEGDNVERQSCWAKRLLALVWIGNYGKVTTYSNTSKSCQDQDDHTFTNNEAKIRDDPWYFRCINFVNHRFKPNHPKVHHHQQQSSPKLNKQKQQQQQQLLLRRVLHVNYHRCTQIKLVKSKIYLRSQLKKHYHMLVLKYRVYKTKLLRICTLLKHWFINKKRRMKRSGIRLRRRYTIAAVLCQNSDTNSSAIIDHNKPDHLTFYCSTNDNFMQTHQMFLRFEMYRLHLLCRYRMQFTFLTI